MAGSDGIHGVPGVDNVDLSSIIGVSHRNYKSHLRACLVCVGVRTPSYGKPRRGSVGQRVHVAGKGFGILRFLGEFSPEGLSNDAFA